MNQRIQKKKKNPNGYDEAKNDRKHNLHPFNRTHGKGRKDEARSTEKQVNKVQHGNAPTE